MLRPPTASSSTELEAPSARGNRTKLMSEEALCGYKLLVWPIMARCDLRRLYRRRIGVGNKP